MQAPENVEDGAVGVYPQHDVGDGDVLEIRLLGVGEVHLWFPQHFDQEGVVEVHGSGERVVEEAQLYPPLPQVQINTVVLWRRSTISLAYLDAVRVCVYVYVDIILRSDTGFFLPLQFSSLFLPHSKHSPLSPYFTILSTYNTFREGIMLANFPPFCSLLQPSRLFLEYLRRFMSQEAMKQNQRTEVEGQRTKSNELV